VLGELLKAGLNVQGMLRAASSAATELETHAFDPHKWMFTNFDYDCFFVVDREPLIRTLSHHSWQVVRQLHGLTGAACKPSARMYMYTHCMEARQLSITRIFKNGNSQAVRIPAKLAYDRSDLDVEIERVGDEIRIRPARRSLAGVMSTFALFSDDFMTLGRGEHEEALRDEL
jgi:antitoxin VapB